MLFQVKIKGGEPMRKRKLLSVLCGIAMLLTSLFAVGFWGCTQTTNDEGGSTMSSELFSTSEVAISSLYGNDSPAQRQEKLDAAYAKLDNDSPLAETMRTEYDQTILKKWYNYFLSMFVSSKSGHIQDVEQELPLENLRQVDEGHYYAVYKVKEAGWLYLFFNGIKNDEKNVLLHAGATLLSVKTLRHDDFDGIKAGDSLDKVIAVDPTARFMPENLTEGLVPHTRHLLTDGVLLITYTQTDDSFFVKDLQYNPEFQIGESAYKILPQDYPQ
jgi:hypothetical protein